MKRKVDAISNDQDEKFLDAIEANDQSKVLSLITEHPQLIDKMNQEWHEPFLLAIQYCDLSILKILIGAGLNLNMNSDKISVINGITNVQRSDIVEYLISIEQGLEFLNTKDNDGQTLLYMLLFRAARVGDLETIKLILNLKIDVTTVDYCGRNVIHIAAYNDQLNIVEYLISTEDLRLLNIKDNEGQTPLHKASSTNSIQMIELLVKKGADTTIPDNDGNNILHIVVRKSRSTDVEHLLSIPKILELLNTKNNHGQTPLHIAASKHIKMIKLLIKKGADIIGSDNDGENALHIAAKYGMVDITQYLLMQGLTIDKNEKYKKEVNDLIQNYRNVSDNNPSKLIISQAEEIKVLRDKIEELNRRLLENENNTKSLLNKIDHISKFLEDIFCFVPDITQNPVAADVTQLAGSENNGSVELG